MWWITWRIMRLLWLYVSLLWLLLLICLWRWHISIHATIHWYLWLHGLLIHNLLSIHWLDWLYGHILLRLSNILRLHWLLIHNLLHLLWLSTLFCLHFHRVIGQENSTHNLCCICTHFLTHCIALLFIHIQ